MTLTLPVVLGRVDGIIVLGGKGRNGPPPLQTRNPSFAATQRIDSAGLLPVVYRERKKITQPIHEAA
jgi:hypothetical protein